MHMGKGLVACVSCDWPEADRELTTALAIYRNRCPGTFFERSNTQRVLFVNLVSSGDLVRLQRRVVQAAHEAERRGDRFATSVAMLGDSVYGWLCESDPEWLLMRVDKALEDWPTDRYLTPHVGHLQSSVQTDLYLGRTRSAWERVARAWPRVRSAGFLISEYLDVRLRFLRARAACGVLGSEHTDAEGRVLLAVVRADLRRLERSDLSVARVYAGAVRACSANAMGKSTEAEASLSQLLRTAESAAMPLHGAAASIAIGTIGGGSEGERLSSTGYEWFESRGVREPSSFVRMLLPTF